MMIVLETERLQLREFVPGDADALAAVSPIARRCASILSRLIALASNHGLNATSGVIGMMVTGFGPWF